MFDLFLNGKKINSIFRSSFMASVFGASFVLMSNGDAFAAESSSESVKKRWSGEGELGFVVTQGNTETKNLNAGLALAHEMGVWENSYAFEALNESQEDAASAEKYGLKLQSNRKLSAENFLLAAFTYDDDRFSGFDYEMAASLGYGRRLISRVNMQLDAEVGPGYRFTKIKDEGEEEEGILRSALKFRYQFTEHSRFTQSLINTAGDSRVITVLDSSITAQVVGNLAMKLSLSVKHNSEPADDTRKETDTETAFTLVYSF